MPSWYTTATDDHLAVLTLAGLFDTIHMTAVIVAGANDFGNITPPHCTDPFAGQDLCKVTPPAEVLDANGDGIATVFSLYHGCRHWADCRSDSIVSSLKPAYFEPKGLCFGFVKVNHVRDNGAQVNLKDPRHALSVTIVQDIEPRLKGRKPIQSILQSKD